MKAQPELQLLLPESTKIFVPGLLENYVNRPDQLEYITLSQLAANCTYTKARPGSSGARETDAQGQQHEAEDGAPADVVENAPVKEENVGVPGQVFALKNNDGYIKRRNVPKVIGYFKYDVGENPEDYFRTLLKLYCPRRNEEA